jgi:hypothetical protein
LAAKAKVKVKAGAGMDLRDEFDFALARLSRAEEKLAMLANRVGELESAVKRIDMLPKTYVHLPLLEGEASGGRVSPSSKPTSTEDAEHPQNKPGNRRDKRLMLVVLRGDESSLGQPELERVLGEALKWTRWSVDRVSPVSAGDP